MTAQVDKNKNKLSFKWTAHRRWPSLSLVKFGFNRIW